MRPLQRKRARGDDTAGPQANGQPLPQRTHSPSKCDFRTPLLPWGLDYVDPALDSIDGEELAQCLFITGKKVRPQHMSQLGLALQHVLRPLLRTQQDYTLQGTVGLDPASLTPERATTLLDLTPRLLLSTDGRMSSQGRFDAFLTGNMEGILS